MIQFVLDEADQPKVDRLIAKYKSIGNDFLGLASILEKAPHDVSFEEAVNWIENSNTTLAAMLLAINHTRDLLTQKYRTPEGKVEDRDRIPL